MPPQVTSLARKPLSIAFEEIAADKIVGIAADPVDELGGFDVARSIQRRSRAPTRAMGMDAAGGGDGQTSSRQAAEMRRGMDAEDTEDAAAAGAEPEADGPAVEA